MGSGKPVGDGIYWPLNKVEEERLLSSQRGARNQANISSSAAPPAQSAPSRAGGNIG
jgi:hypothetical protein